MTTVGYMLSQFAVFKFVTKFLHMWHNRRYFSPDLLVSFWKTLYYSGYVFLNKCRFKDFPLQHQRTTCWGDFPVIFGHESLLVLQNAVGI